MDIRHVFIVGFGAIGKALSVSLSTQGRAVTVIRGSVNDGSRTVENITVQQADGATLAQTLEVTTVNNLDAISGLIVVTSKSFGNLELANTLKSKSGNSPVVLLQNGLGVEQPFLKAGFSQVYRCVLFATSQVLENGIVKFRPVLSSPVGLVKGSRAGLRRTVEMLDTPYFQFRPEENIQNIIWKKAIINTVFNSVCPLLETDNGIFYREPTALEFARKLIQPCISIAGKAGVYLTLQEVETDLVTISSASDGQQISTLQDISRGKQTEIDTLNFEIARLAGEFQMPAEAKDILLLGELIKIKEKINLKNS